MREDKKCRERKETQERKEGKKKENIERNREKVINKRERER